MGLDELTSDVEAAYADLEAADLALTDESKMELAMLQAAMGEPDTAALVDRAVHRLFQSTTETGKLDFHLRGNYDVTYDEYLSGMTYDEMAGGADLSGGDDDRRYQF
ncbi:MAG: hypothetical protein ABEJ60_01430 [Halodesulfurarchaeum sp.]